MGLVADASHLWKIQEDLLSQGFWTGRQLDWH